MDTIACRDISDAKEWGNQLREIIESTPFQCAVSVYPQYNIGLMRVEYRGHSKREVEECDLKLYAKIISFFEAKGDRNLKLLPLKFGQPQFSLCADCGNTTSDEVAYCYGCGRSLCKECGELSKSCFYAKNMAVTLCQECGSSLCKGCGLYSSCETARNHYKVPV